MNKSPFCLAAPAGALLLALTTWSASLHAQPDAGQLLNQQQRDATPTTRPDPRGRAQDPLPADSAAAFRARIVAVRFTGADGLLAASELQAAVADAVGKELSHAQLQALAARVTALLQDRGWPLARAYLPRQDLTEGTLEIAVLQGRLESGAQRVQLANGSAVSTAVLQGIAEAAIPAASLHSSDLERALLLMNDLAGVTARARLERGNEPGTSRLMVMADPAPDLRTQVTLDNFLNRYTGAVRGGVRVSWANPSGVGDAAGLGLTLSTGNQGLNGSYTRALTASGLRLNLGASTLRYSIGQDLKALDLNGQARSLTLGASYPVLRSRAASVWLAADAEARALRDNSVVGNLRDRRLQRLQFSAYGSAWDAVGQGGSTDWSLAAAAGRVNLNGNADDAALDARTAGSQGSYGRIAGQVGRSQALTATADWLLFAGLSGQFASGNLDSSEKFGLGGPSGVRAYAVGEASGDAGWLATLELRREFLAAPRVQAQALAFVDTGAVSLHKRPWAGALPAGRDNQLTLSGAGLGVNLYGPGWQLRSAVARAIGSNAGRQPDGRDADGRTARTRAWLQASFSF